MYTTEIFMAYIRGRAAYKIVTPYKTVIRVLKDIDDVAVLEALRATRTRDAVLITKSKFTNCFSKGHLLGMIRRGLSKRSFSTKT
jgi:hypothetical protein